ncbi:MAG: glycosyltransferase family 4 protein, partial [Isosphaeraceae bacterium]
LPTVRPLRIAFVISLFHPVESGAERQARLQAEELARRGHDVTVYTRALENLPRNQYHLSNENGGKVQIRRVIQTSSRGPLFGFSFIHKLAGSLREDRQKIDVIHSHQALWESITLGLAKDFIKTPALIQPASSGFDGEAQEIMRTRGASVLRRFAIRSPQFACISDDIAAEWLSLGVPESKIIKVCSGVDVNQFRPADCSPMADSKSFQAVFTGRLHDQKQVDVLIKAWPSVLKRVKARLVIAGDGPLKNELVQLRDSLSLSENEIEFMGRVANTEELLRVSDLFVLPSRAEGMSNSLLEAMATGLPCIVSNIGGNTDLIDHEHSGFLVRSSDPELWSDALLSAYRNPEAARRWGHQARQKVVRDFSIESVVDRNLVIYRRLLNQA